MTEYLYGLSLATQTKNFLFSLGFGFTMGIFYDVFRIIRMSISQRKTVVIIFDVLYCVFLGFSDFIFFITVNEGQVRLYLLCGELIGFAVYYFSLGAIVFSLSEKVIGFIRKSFKRIFSVLIFPFKWIFTRLRYVCNKIIKKGQKRSKKLKNKSKFLLKVDRYLLYNLNGKM